MDAHHGDSRLEPDRERALVARSRFDAAAFGELYDWYLPRIFGFVLRRVGNRAVAEDLTAMTFERALGAVRRADFRNDSFGGFLYRIAGNAIVDQARRERRVAAPDPRSPGADQSLEEIGDERAAAAFAAAVDREALGRALLAIPESHRRVIVLRFFDGLEGDELGAALGCSRGTVAVRLHRALRVLRATMAQEAVDAA
jgi:RNA polymerase sigma-70 factor (ECF subfamily)